MIVCGLWWPLMASNLEKNPNKQVIISMIFNSIHMLSKKYQNMACHTLLESSSMALLGYGTFGSPNQIIWWQGAFKVEQS